MNSRRCMCCPSEDHTLSHHCRGLPRCASQQNWPPMRWVRPPHWTARPLFHRKRKSIRDLVMSQECRERAHAPRFPDHARTSKLIDLARCFMPLRRSMDREGTNHERTALNSSKVPRRPHHEHPWGTCGKGLTQTSNWITENAPSATNVLALRSRRPKMLLPA